MLCRHFKISKEDDATLPDVISITHTAVSQYVSGVHNKDRDDYSRIPYSHSIYENSDY